METGMATDRGRCRELNEDSFGWKDNLFVLADGMGGHNAGEVASALAVEEILRIDPNQDEFIPSLRLFLNQANQVLLDYAEQHPECRGMGTTIALVKVETDKITVAHVGDSRVYLWRQAELTQLTRDHSVVEELVRVGGLTEEEAQNHPHRNLLTKALGTQGEVGVEINEVAVDQGDRVLLCTDGLTSMLGKEEINQILSANLSAQEIADTLVTEANQRGGADNITVIVIKI
ncbi:MAG TPA: Stp1/IreP family PP2C-type Ser/Thr phosphatase [Firmicutes bacterium]|nr:Stp1/IreP family PP2C-type Ser/Thr phosphatase [Bacillota bacterium]